MRNNAMEVCSVRKDPNYSVWSDPTGLYQPSSRTHIILIVSFWTARKVIYQHVALIAVWCTLTFIMILSLSLVACRNPGIMYRQVEMPGEGWLWNDQARTFRPKNAKFDPDCQAVIEGFDHTCPWTGTGIGRQNICAFRVFLGSLVACLILDIIIITNPF